MRRARGGHRVVHVGDRLVAVNKQQRGPGNAAAMIRVFESETCLAFAAACGAAAAWGPQRRHRNNATKGGKKGDP